MGGNITGDYKSLDSERAAIKDERGNALQTALDCMGTFTVLFLQNSTDIISSRHVEEGGGGLKHSHGKGSLL